MTVHSAEECIWELGSGQSKYGKWYGKGQTLDQGSQKGSGYMYGMDRAKGNQVLKSVLWHLQQ